MWINAQTLLLSWKTFIIKSTTHAIIVVSFSPSHSDAHDDPPDGNGGGGGVDSSHLFPTFHSVHHLSSVWHVVETGNERSIRPFLSSLLHLLIRIQRLFQTWSVVRTFDYCSSCPKHPNDTEWFLDDLAEQQSSHSLISWNFLLRETCNMSTMLMS